MRLEEYRETITESLRQSTLCFLLKGDQILLAMKKRGFGAGKLNGVGGKLNPDETIEKAAKREVDEEIGVDVNDLEQVATLDFYFPHNPSWNQQVIVFLAKSWVGEPMESEEMSPQWFGKNKIPFEKMWPDDKYWLPLVLDGKKVEAEFLLGPKQEIIDYTVQTL